MAAKKWSPRALVKVVPSRRTWDPMEGRVGRGMVGDGPRKKDGRSLPTCLRRVASSGSYRERRC